MQKKNIHNAYKVYVLNNTLKPYKIIQSSETHTKNNLLETTATFYYHLYRPRIYIIGNFQEFIAWASIRPAKAQWLQCPENFHILLRGHREGTPEMII